jgi:hypothetical protein
MECGAKLLAVADGDADVRGGTTRLVSPAGFAVGTGARGAGFLRLMRGSQTAPHPV